MTTGIDRVLCWVSTDKGGAAGWREIVMVFFLRRPNEKQWHSEDGRLHACSVSAQPLAFISDYKSRLPYCT